MQPNAVSGNVLPSASKAAVAALLALATLVALFAVAVGVLDRVARLDYGTLVTALILCTVAGLALSVAAAWYPPLQSSTTGENRRAFTRLAACASVLLPLETFVEDALVYGWEHGVAFRPGIWWFTIPAQFVVGGLLGLIVAITKRKWMWAIWGVISALCGALWVTAILFWAR
jgi:hypothetical protein